MLEYFIILRAILNYKDSQQMKITTDVLGMNGIDFISESSLGIRDEKLSYAALAYLVH